jgi:hypothetical protein
MERFDNLKEESSKFIVRCDHDGTIWLANSIEIIPRLINFMTRFPIKGYLVPFGMKNTTLFEKFTSFSSKGKNSKFLQISSIEMPTIKWATLIVSIFLTFLD